MTDRTIYIFSKRRVLLDIVDVDHLNAVAKARKVSDLLDTYPHAVAVSQLLPADRDQRTWYDPSDGGTLHMSALTIIGLAMWLASESLDQPPKSSSSWINDFDSWFGDGTGDTVPAMLKEAVALALNERLSGEEGYFQNRTFEGNPEAWTAITGSSYPLMPLSIEVS